VANDRLLAELERSLISERTPAAVKAAKRRGVKFGPKPKLTPQQLDRVRELIDKGDRDRQGIADLFKVSRTTLYRALASWRVGTTEIVHGPARRTNES